MKTWGTILVGFRLLAGLTFGQSTILWDESVNGDLSKDHQMPNLLATLQIGTNSVTGKTEDVPTPPSHAVYPDFFTLQILNGHAVSAIYLQVDKPSVWTWIGDTSFSTELGFAGNPASGELLQQWGLTHLSPGNYGMYLANLDAQSVTSIANYRLDFVVQSIPEPSTFAPLMAGGVWLLGLRCARSR